MPIAEVEVNGRVVEIEVPEGATNEQINAFLSSARGQSQLREMLSQAPEPEAKPFDEAAFKAGPVPTGDGRENLVGALTGMFGSRPAAEAIADSPVSEVALGFGRSVDSTIRGLKQIAATPQEALAMAKVEERAREQFADIEEGLGPEDFGEALAVTATLFAPGGAPLKGLQGAARVMQAVKNIPSSWGGLAVLSGLSELSQARTADESRAVEAGKTFALTGLAGAAGSKLSTLVGRKFMQTGAGSTLAATLGSTIGSPQSKRLFREGVVRKAVRLVLGRRPTQGSDPIERALLRSGGQEDARLLREAAKAQAQVQSRPGVTAETIDEFLGGFDDIVKAIRPTKASKAAGLTTTAGVRTEANTMLGILQDAAYKTNPDGTAFIDVGALRNAYNGIKRSDKFTQVFSKPKQKQMDELVDRYIKSAMTANKNVGDVKRPFEEALAVTQGLREKGMKEVEEYLKAQLGLPASRKFSATTAVGTWMLQNDVSAEDIEQLFQEEGFVGQLDLFDTIREQVVEEE